MKIPYYRIISTIPKKYRKSGKDVMDLVKYIVKKRIKEYIELPDALISKTISVIDEISERSYMELEGKYRKIITFPIVPFPADPFGELRCLRDCEEEHGHWLILWMLTRLADVIKEREEIVTIFAKLELVKVAQDDETNYAEGMFKHGFYYLTPDSSGLSKLRKDLFAQLQKIDDESKKKIESLALTSNKFFIINGKKINFSLNRQHHILEFLCTHNNGEYHTIEEMKDWWVKQLWYQNDLPIGAYESGTQKLTTFFRSGVQKIREEYYNKIILSKKNAGYKLNPQSPVEIGYNK